MIPTNKLRFVELTVYVGQGDYEKQRNLQQLWIIDEHCSEEDTYNTVWIDVPTVNLG
jgi:hypothetical protein